MWDNLNGEQLDLSITHVSPLPSTAFSDIQHNSWSRAGTPVVSIVMPTKDRLTLAKRAVKSVLNQSFGGWELIILDDSSSHEREKIDELRTDSRIRMPPRPKNSSVAMARTIGVDESLGRFVTFLDSDDYYASNRLERHLRVWSNKGDRLGFSWDVCVELDGGSRSMSQPFGEGIVARPRVARRLFGGNFIHASAGFMRTDYARRVDFSWNVFSDWLLFMRLGERYDAYFLNESLTFRDLGAEGRVSNQLARQFFYSQSLSLRRRLLRTNPRVYIKPWIARDLSRFKKRVSSIML